VSVLEDIEKIDFFLFKNICWWIKAIYV